MPLSGSTSGSLRMRSSIGSSPQRDGQLVHRRLQREHARALARRAHPRRRRHVERGRGGGSCGGSAPRTSRAWPPPSARRTRCSVEVCSTRRGDRGQPAVRVGAEPHALDRRRPVAGEREHLLAGERELDRAADGLARRARREHGCGRGVPLEPKPPPTCGEITRTLLRLEPEDLRERAARACARPGWSRRASGRRRSQTRERRVRLHRVVVVGRRRVRRVDA